MAGSCKQITDGIEAILDHTAGAIGFPILQIARVASAGKIFIADIRDARLSAAMNFGAGGAFNGSKFNTVDEILKQMDGLRVRFAFEAIGLESKLTQTL